MAAKRTGSTKKVALNSHPTACKTLTQSLFHCTLERGYATGTIEKHTQRRCPAACAAKFRLYSQVAYKRRGDTVHHLGDSRRIVANRV